MAELTEKQRCENYLSAVKPKDALKALERQWRELTPDLRIEEALSLSSSEHLEHRTFWELDHEPSLTPAQLKERGFAEPE